MRRMDWSLMSGLLVVCSTLCLLDTLHLMLVECNTVNEETKLSLAPAKNMRYTSSRYRPITTVNVFIADGWSEEYPE